MHGDTHSRRAARTHQPRRVRTRARNVLRTVAPVGAFVIGIILIAASGPLVDGAVDGALTWVGVETLLSAPLVPLLNVEMPIHVGAVTGVLWTVVGCLVLDRKYGSNH